MTLSKKSKLIQCFLSENSKYPQCSHFANEPCSCKCHEQSYYAYLTLHMKKDIRGKKVE